MTDRLDAPPVAELRPDGVLVATRRHWYSHWSPRPMVEVEGDGVARVSDVRWEMLVVPHEGATLTFFCWDLLQPRFATYAVHTRAGDALVYDAGARMPWSRRSVTRFAADDPRSPWKPVPKVAPRRLSLREEWRGLFRPPHATVRPCPVARPE